MRNHGPHYEEMDPLRSLCLDCPRYTVTDVDVDDPLNEAVTIQQSQVLTPITIGTYEMFRHSKNLHKIAAMVEQALKDNGYQMQLSFYPGKRLIAQLNNGIIDGDLYRSAAFGKKFDAIVRVEEPLIQSCALFFRLKDHANQGLEKHNRLGLYAGAPGPTEKVLERWPKAKAVFFSTLKQGTALLQNQRIEALAVPHMQEQEFLKIAIRPVVLVDAFAIEPSYLYLHARHRALADNLAITLRKLKKHTVLPECDHVSLRQALQISNAQDDITRHINH